VGGWRNISVGMLALALAASVACGQHSASPVITSGSPEKVADRFLHVPTEVPEGAPPSSTAVVPFGTRVPAGTLLTIRLVEPLSSANAHADEVFDAVLDQDVMLDGQMLLEHGTPVRGRVVESAPKRSGRGPGYLRLTLTEISIGGKPKAVRTYSSFLKGPGPVRRSVVNSFPGERLVADTAVLDRGLGPGDDPQADEPEAIVVPKAADVQLGVDRRLTFHLLEPLSVSVP
jgi:hypothetical protein